MREYRRLRKMVTWFLALYFVGGLLTLLLPQKEIFPVFSWFLFAEVPQSSPQYALLLREVNGKSIEPPRLYQEAAGLVSAPHSVTVFKLTQQLGNAIEKNPSDKTGFRELLEKNWLPPQTHYQIVVIDSDPVARWKTGRYEITRHLGTFTNSMK